MDKNNPFESTINTLNKTAEAVDDATRKMNNEETTSSQEENTDPTYVLYNAIADNAIELLKNDNIINTFKKIADTMGEDVSKSMVEMMAILMTQSSYQALIFYDALLKQDLDKQFNHFAEHINKNAANINAQVGAMKVFKTQLGNIQKKMQIGKLEEDRNK